MIKRIQKDAVFENRLQRFGGVRLRLVVALLHVRPCPARLRGSR
jgi:hypothetical protein